MTKRVNLDSGMLQQRQKQIRQRRIVSPLVNNMLPVLMTTPGNEDREMFCFMGIRISEIAPKQHCSVV